MREKKTMSYKMDIPQIPLQFYTNIYTHKSERELMQSVTLLATISKYIFRTSNSDIAPRKVFTLCYRAKEVRDTMSTRNA